MDNEKSEAGESHKHTSHHQKKSSKDLLLQNILIGAAAILAILLVFNIISSFGIDSKIKENVKTEEEQAKPAKIQLIAVKDSKCTECLDVATIVNLVKEFKAEVTKEDTFEFGSDGAKAAIEKYGITALPTVIITGEIDKLPSEGFEKKDGALVLSQAPAPFTDAKTGKIEGLVTAYILKDPTCTQCNDMLSLLNQMHASGIRIPEQKEVDVSSEAGKKLIKDYDIGFVPTIILSKDAKFYPIIEQAWPNIGSVEKDGTYVLRTPYPPFINQTTQQLKGLVSLTYLKDQSCAECYNVSLHRDILTNPQSFAIKIVSEKSLDIKDTEAKQLIVKYNISQVPTVILSKDLGDYGASKSLRQFFSVEKDGSFVFRSLQSLGAYRDLGSGEIVKPQTSEQ